MRDEVIINGIAYVPKKSTDGMPYVIARTYSAGVFAGYFESREVGHSSATMTQRYSHLSNRETSNAVRILDRRAGNG